MQMRIFPVNWDHAAYASLGFFRVSTIKKIEK